MNNPTKSPLDKLSIVSLSPYKNTIFLDSDSLIYGNIDSLFNLFNNDFGFTCFGKSYPLGSKKGWFYYNKIGEYNKIVSNEIDLHGGMYFINKSIPLEKFKFTIDNICKNYESYEFTTPIKCDETIFALAIAAHHWKPISYLGNVHFYFYPNNKKECKKIKLDVKNASNSTIVHFSNICTFSVKYMIDSTNIINSFIKKETKISLLKKIRCEIFYFLKFTSFVLKKILQKFKRILKKL